MFDNVTTKSLKKLSANGYGAQIIFYIKSSGWTATWIGMKLGMGAGKNLFKCLPNINTTVVQ